MTVRGCKAVLFHITLSLGSVRNLILFVTALLMKWWNANKYSYLSTVVMEEFSVYFLSLFFFTTAWMETLHFFMIHILLVTLYQDHGTALHETVICRWSTSCFIFHLQIQGRTERRCNPSFCTFGAIYDYFCFTFELVMHFCLVS